MRRQFLAFLTLIGTAMPAMPAEAAERRFMVTDFDRIDAVGPHEFVVVTGRPPGVTASGDSASLDRLKVTVSSRRLRIVMGQENGWEWNKSQPLRIEISAHQLAGVVMGGSGTMAVDRMQGDSVSIHVAGTAVFRTNQIAARALDLAISGRGDMTLAGRCDSGRLSLQGVGSIHAEALLCKDVDGKIQGSGQIMVHAERKATLSVTGAGEITVSGAPECKVTQVGSGRIRCGDKG